MCGDYVVIVASDGDRGDQGEVIVDDGSVGEGILEQGVIDHDCEGTVEEDKAGVNHLFVLGRMERPPRGIARVL